LAILTSISTRSLYFTLVSLSLIGRGHNVLVLHYLGRVVIKFLMIVSITIRFWGADVYDSLFCSCQISFLDRLPFSAICNTC
jgi:hypothetical protein